MWDSSKGIWENKLHRKLKLIAIMFSEYFLPSKSLPEWDVVGRLAQGICQGSFYALNKPSCFYTSHSSLSAWLDAPSGPGRAGRCVTLIHPWEKARPKALPCPWTPLQAGPLSISRGVCWAVSPVLTQLRCIRGSRWMQVFMQRQKQTVGRRSRTTPTVKSLFGKDLSENNTLIAPKNLQFSIVCLL